MLSLLFYFIALLHYYICNFSMPVTMPTQKKEAINVS